MMMLNILSSESNQSVLPGSIGERGSILANHWIRSGSQSENVFKMNLTLNETRDEESLFEVNWAPRTRARSGRCVLRFIAE